MAAGQVAESNAHIVSQCACQERGLHHHNQVQCVPPVFLCPSVVERALAVWPSLLLYMEAVKTKRLSNPGTASYDTVAAAIKDPLILAKLQFYAALARTFTPFLKKYQTDNPVLPFLPKDLTELMMSLLRRFIKREVLHDITALQLTKLDVTDKTIWLSPQDISIGLGAESVLKSIKGAELRVLEFKRECMQGLCNIIRKVQDKSPLKYLTVRQLVCLDPSVMYREPERCRNHMKGLVQRFLQDKQLTDTSAGDVILQQFDSLLSLKSRSEDFLSFPPMQKRLDVFLCSAMEPYPELWAFCKKLLILSHGQATVERGFSINKEVESDNLKEDTVVTRRLVCDYIIQHGGVTQVPLSKQLLASVARARTRYRIHLETNRKNKEAKDQALKRKEAEDCLQELKVKRRCIQEVSEGLARDADRLAEEAEAKAGSKMADLTPGPTSCGEAIRRSWQKWLSLIKRSLLRVQNLGVDCVIVILFIVEFILIVYCSRVYSPYSQHGISRFVNVSNVKKTT
ncbi:uncharacterized protein LOC114462415 [Gouania willdenowi]|uniref:uncharacterized protein LOC114462415 n=1 Tax=Gouania willdenowi TaxID=441366 RepID=UPI001054CE4D|nr:uncharacterized protein LOC114462415 [Gouania willdenowi]